MWVMCGNILSIAMKKQHKTFWFFGVLGVGKIPAMKRVTILRLKTHFLELKASLFGVAVEDGIGVVKKLRTRA